jgi:hypothetical protein
MAKAAKNNNQSKKSKQNESKTDLPDMKNNSQTENTGKSMKEKI